MSRQPCSFFLSGSCHFGSECRFSHAVVPTPTPAAPQHPSSSDGPIAYRPPQTRGQSSGAAPPPAMVPRKRTQRVRPKKRVVGRPSQLYEYFLVLDFEGKDEVTEFPVLCIDAVTLEEVSCFHRYCMPQHQTEEWIASYGRNKYGEWGLEETWLTTGIKFQDALRELHEWMVSLGLLAVTSSGEYIEAKRFAFVICGNWDIKTQVPDMCRLYGIPVPQFFLRWVNLKDAYCNFYGHKATGMRGMLNGLQLPLEGNHHSGIDDTRNIANVLREMVRDGCVIDHTGWRAVPGGPVTFRFEDRVDRTFGARERE